jgi:hypothetical protein
VRVSRPGPQARPEPRSAFPGNCCRIRNDRIASPSHPFPKVVETESLTKAGLVLGDLVVTGPTLTNVSDFRAILIYGV